MPSEVIMPKLGLTMTEGTIIEWLIKEGDAVKAGEHLLVVETDKVALDVEARVAGVLLRILAPAGSSIPLGGVIAYIGATGEEIPKVAKPAEPPTPVAVFSQPAASVADQAATDGDLLRVSPIARRLAAENNLDLKSIRGTGPQGRILESDIARSLQERASAPASPYQAPPATIPIPGLPSHVVFLSPVRRTTARRMTQSFTSAPHFYLSAEIDAARLVKLRAALQPEFENSLHLRLTFSDLILRALSLCLPLHPMLNASFRVDGEALAYDTINLGLAVATPQGLVAPVIHSAEKLSLEEISRHRYALAEKARENTLRPEDMSGGTFTMTNLGMYGVDDFLPILNPPQSAILAVGALADRPAEDAGRVVIRPTLRLTLGVDHRVADGADGALFLQSLRGILEDSEGLR